MHFRSYASLITAMAVGLCVSRTYGIVTSNTNLDVSQLIGANTFYSHGFTGTGAIVANIEAGYIWNGQQTLTNVTTEFSDGSVTGQFDRHATWVGSTIAGQGSITQDRGIAYGATLWSGAIATGWNTAGAGNYSGNFNITTASFTTPYLDALVTGVNGNGTADVINSSWSSSGDQNGLDYLAVVMDSLINKGGKLVVFAAGNSGPATNSIGAPSSGINEFVVGALQSDTSTPAYGSIASFSSRSPTDFFVPTDTSGSTGTDVLNARARINITAPGQNLTLAHYGGATGGNSFGGATDSLTNAFDTNLAGTSFAAPITAASAALVVDAGKVLFPTDSHAIDGRVLQAVLMNSASRPTAWNNGQTSVGGVITTTQALDYTYGGGILNLNNAYSQYTAGTTDVPSLTGGTVNPVGWAFGQITHGTSAAHDDYLINTPVAAGGIFTVTLDWYADETTDANGLNPAYGSFDNLDLQVWRTIGGVPVTLVAQSDSLYDATEELSFVLPTSGTYMIRVLENNYLWDFNGDTTTDFGLAWTVPEPAALALFAAGGLLLLRRRARG